MDGTFKIYPEMFSQLSFIHIQLIGIMLPVCFALLPPKNQEIYTRFLNNLSHAAKQQQFQLSPTFVYTDVETAIINSIRNKFPNTQIWGCLFDYAQSIWSKWENIGLKQRCKECEAVNRLVRRATVLTLLPLNAVDEV